MIKEKHDEDMEHPGRDGRLFPVISGWSFTAQQAPPVVAQVVADGASAKPKRVDNTHKTRFIEISPRPPRREDREAGRRVLQHDVHGLGYPNRRTWPRRCGFEGLDFDAMKKDLGIAWRSTERPEAVVIRLGGDGRLRGADLQRHCSHVHCPAEHGRQRRRRRRNQALPAPDHRPEE